MRPGAAASYDGGRSELLRASSDDIAIAELIDPDPVRQLATLDTPIGMHTFPVENGGPVILDPRVPRNALVSGIAMPEPIQVDVHDAIEWTAQLAEAGAAPYRNGPSRAPRAQRDDADRRSGCRAE